MASLPIYSAGGSRLQIEYWTSSSNTTTRLYVALDEDTDYAYVDSATVSVKVNGSTSFSLSYNKSTDGVPVVVEGESWGRLKSSGKDYSKGHSSTSYSLSFTLTIRVNNNSYTKTWSGYSFTVPARASYSVTYNANGGSYAPSSQTKWYDETLTLTSSTPSRTGYVFWHWNTNSSNSGTTYNKGGSYTSNSSLYLYAIWNPVIYYNANGGTNAPPSQTKTYGTALTLSSIIPTRAGYQFFGWGTSQSSGVVYQAGGSYTSNTTATLYAQWLKVADPPTISSISAIRCNSSGTSDDMGTYCRLRAYWSVDTTSAGMSSNQGAVTGTIVSEGGQSRTITFTSGTSGTSGTAAALIPDCDTDTQYTITVTVRNTVIGTGQSSILSTSRSDVLTRAFFTIDFAAGGEGVGIGTAAPREGFECGFDAQFNRDVDILGNMTAANLTVTEDNTTANVATANGTFVVDSASAVRYGPIVMVNLTIKTGESLSSGTDYNMANLASAYRPPKWLGIGTDFGGGEISNYGNIYLRPSISVNSNVTIHVSAIFIKG